jgi:hypothetical protein
MVSQMLHDYFTDIKLFYISTYFSLGSVFFVFYLGNNPLLAIGISTDNAQG